MTIDWGSVHWTTYSVAGTTLAEAQQAMAHLPEAANVQWRGTWTFQPDQHGKLTQVTITVTRMVEMPDWTGRGSASPAAQSEWDRFLAAVRTHEEGHLTLIEQHLRGTDDRMLGHSQAGAQGIYDAAVAAVHAANTAYDAENDHGRRAGTVLNVDIV